MANDVFPGALLMQLVEWGFPRGSLRPTPPATKAFSVIHITGNARLPSAEGEVTWRLNDPALQNSATFFVNRDGSVVQALGDPLHMDPWANGDVRSPDLGNPRIAAMVRDGVNANERTLVAIENVGYEPGYSITAAQEATDARIIAYYHAKAGVPVSRETVIGHYQLNSIARPNCPGVNKALIDRIVVKAAASATLPDTSTEDDVDPNELIPIAVCKVAPGGAVYDNPDRQGTPLIASYVGSDNVGLYAKPANPTTSPAPLVPIRIEVARSLKVGYVGWDKVSDVRAPGQVLDCTAQVLAARNDTKAKAIAAVEAI